MIMCFLLFALPLAHANGEHWLTGWAYRKSHLVYSAADSGAAYQINVTVYYGSGSDSSYAVYLNSRCRTDFGDVRWTDNDGITLLGYYIWSKTDGNNAVFWIKVADSLSTQNATIYIYYGKSVLTTSNGQNTFTQFDDFNSLDSWTLDRYNDTQTATIENGQLKLTHNVAAFCHIETSMTFDNIAVQVKLKRTDDYNESLWGMGLCLYFNQYDYVAVKLINLIGTYPRWFRWFKDVDGVLGTTYVWGHQWTNNTYTWLRICLSPTKVYLGYSLDGFTWDNVVVWTRQATWTTPSLIIIGHGHEYKVGNAENADWDNNGTIGESVVTWADDYLVRKFVDPEPRQGVWGSEELPPPVPVTNTQRWIGIAAPHIYAAIIVWSLAMIIGVGAVLAKGDIKDLPFVILMGIALLICLFITLVVMSPFLKL
jgi:hypothetical protein